MKKLLSLPPNLVSCFHEINQADANDWFCTSDPEGMKLGSGGGTAWLLDSCRRNEDPNQPLAEWLPLNRRILIHAGGQGRRVPAYSPSGKILTPIPIFRWARGQHLDQNLLSIQLPLFEKIMALAPERFHTMVCSGDVLLRSTQPLQPIPDVDVVCYGLWTDVNLARNHGVFALSRKQPDVLDYMLQKPAVDTLTALMPTHYFLVDVGLWLLSDKAVQVLMNRSVAHGQFVDYDLYGTFGLGLGQHPQIADAEVNALRVAVLPLQGGEFYHYGTTPELISSTLKIQHLVTDQREIFHLHAKPHPALFVQNAEMGIQLTADNSEIWIENSCIGSRWTLHRQSVITGVPHNDWVMDVPPGVCIDVVPMGEHDYVARPYGFADRFKGKLADTDTLFMGQPFAAWLRERRLGFDVLCPGLDIQSAPLFPLCRTVDELALALRWMLSEPSLAEGRNVWLHHRRFSADDLSAQANLRRLTLQRNHFRAGNWSVLARNHERSVFYQLDLQHAAMQFVENGLDLPAPLPNEAPLMTQINDNMFRARCLQLQGKPSAPYEQRAFQLMREGIGAAVMTDKSLPRCSVYADQIVWGRSPVRVDLAGGWTDTPPYCLNEGGSVVNMAVELNGQPPLQVYAKPGKEYCIKLRSIDLGATEQIRTYEQLADFAHVGSPFAIPKAALALAGFLPAYCCESFPTLEDQLKAFGCGIELTLLAAVPSGSGLGTSSILAATVLGTLSDFCGLGWHRMEICKRTLVLEQLLTTGGGWQDQYGGVLPGIKLMQTPAGMDQTPVIKWLPTALFSDSEHQACQLLYYTGLTRTAKHILAEIVRGLFLNSSAHLSLIEQVKAHAMDVYEAIQLGQFESYGKLVGKSWELNKQLDAGTNPPAVASIIDRVADLCLGLKLPGAGGGGFLYMVAKDAEAAHRIRHLLNQEPPNPRARFVEMKLSDKGFQVSRS